MTITEGTVVTATGNVSLGGTLTLPSVNAAGAHTGLLVGVGYRTTSGTDTDDCIASMAFNTSEALSRMTSVAVATPSRNGFLYRLNDPSAVSANVVITTQTSNCRNAAFALPLAGVDDTTPFDTPPTPTSGTSAAPSITVTSESGDVCYAFLWWRDDTITFTPGSGVSVIGGPIFSGSPSGSAHIRGVLLKKAGAASVTMNGTLSASADWIMIGVNANQYIAAGAVAFPSNALAGGLQHLTGGLQS